MILQALKDHIDQSLPDCWNSTIAYHHGGGSNPRIPVLQIKHANYTITISIDGDELRLHEYYPYDLITQRFRNYDLNDPQSLDDFDSYLSEIVNEQ